jgi:hypothetical protein
MYIDTLRGLGPKSVICVSLEVMFVYCADATVAKRRASVGANIVVVDEGFPMIVLKLFVEQQLYL